MSFDVSSLLSPRAEDRDLGQSDFRNESASEIIVSKLPLVLEPAAIRQSLREAFMRLSPGTVVNLRAADFITEQSTQEFKITFSRSVDTTVAETTIHHALRREYDRVGLLFDRRAVHMVFANF